MRITNRAELEQAVRLILSQVRTDIYETSLASQWVSPTRWEGDSVLMLPGYARVINEQVPLLRLLHSDLAPELRSQFVPILLANLAENTAGVVIQTVFDIGTLDDIDRLLGDRKRLPPAERAAVWAAILERLVMESHRFPDQDLIRLAIWARREGETAEASMRAMAPLSRSPLSVLQPDEVRATGSLVHVTRAVSRAIERARYERLATQLTEGINPEINTDKARLVSRMERLGFRPDISSALDEVDQKFAGATKDLEFKSCMDIVRSAYEKMVEDAATTASKARGKPAPTRTSSFKPFKDALMAESVLTADEGKLFQETYNFLSNVGAHQLGSAPEHVRVAKNMVIELGLLLLGRVQTLVEPQPSA